MPTKQKRRVCFKCGRKKVESKINVIHQAWSKGLHGKYECKDEKDCKKFIKNKKK